MTTRMKGNRWSRMRPDLQTAVLDILQRAAEEGLEVGFFDGWRSPEESAANIAAGTSKVTDPYNSYHIWGAAADLVLLEDGEWVWPPVTDVRWKRLIEIGTAAGLVHPLAWDAPHFQLPGVSLSQIRREYGTDYMSYLAENGVIV